MTWLKAKYRNLVFRQVSQAVLVFSASPILSAAANITWIQPLL